MKKRVVSLLLALVMVMGMFSAMTLGANAANPTEGKKFNRDPLYAMRDNVEVKGSATIEAEIWVPNDPNSTTGGVIIGNFGDYGVNEGQKYYRLDIVNGGFVQIHTKYAGVYIFNGVKNNDEVTETLADNKSSGDTDIRNYVGNETDGWKFVKIAVVLDVDDIYNDDNEIIHSGKLTLYINGEKISEIITDTLNFKPLAFNTTAPLCVGGDWRVGEGDNPYAINAKYFGGRIKNVTLYSDLRTEAEILASGTAETYTVDPEDNNLVLAFDCTRTDFWTNLKGSGNDLVLYTRDGTRFEENGIPFQMSKFFSDAQPRTVAAEIFVPHYLTGWNGVICGNKAGEDDIGVFSLEITENGAPALTYTAKDADGKPENKTVIFDKVSVLINEWVKLAVVHEGTALKCYVNGSLKQTVQITDFYQSDMSEAMYPLCIGGDWQRGVDTSFKGVVRDIAFYSEAKTADQVKSIKNNGVSTSDSGLLAYYDLKATDGENSVADSSGNKMGLGKLWFPNRVFDPDDYAYTFAVVGDTQKLVFEDFNNANDDIPENDTNHTATLYQWIVDNAENEKIEFVFGVGDIVEYNYNISGDRGNKIGEWEIAKEAITKLSDAGIPYSLVCGNHDKVYRLDDYFAAEENFTEADIIYYEGTSLGNYCVRFEAGGIKYMVVGLDFGANDLVLRWAAEQIDDNPEYRVIITTHSYLYRDGTTLDADDEVPPNPDGDTGDTALNNGSDMWNELFSQHRNINIVFCGHDGVEDIIWRQDRGEENNLVSQFLVDPQTFDVQQNYQTGMVALFHFSEDGREIAVEWYSTERDMYYKPENQFEVKIIDNFGNGIYSTEYIESDGLVDTYRIYYTNGTYADFTVTNGADGENGTNGTDGTNGINGTNGVTPHIGENGNWFIGDVDTGVSAKGEKGDKGDDGATGESGTDGATPYIGENGNWFIGDVDTGVPAKGAKGDKGDKGDDGAAGESGADGATPYIGENGNWFIGDVDTGVAAKGADGKDGKDGKDGADGDGRTPYIGENGNWFIGDTDTGVSAKGEKGDKGEPGKDGSSGSKGSAGEDGEDGITPHIGENGNWYIGDFDTGVSAKGEKGEDGAQGPQGSQGESGEDGEDGEAPYIGENGNWYVEGIDTGIKAQGEDGESASNTAVVVLGVATGVSGVISICAIVMCAVLLKKKRII